MTRPDWRLRRLILLLSLLKPFLSVVPLLPACLHLGKLPVVDDPGQLALHQSHLKVCSFKSLCYKWRYSDFSLQQLLWFPRKLFLLREITAVGMQGLVSNCIVHTSRALQQEVIVVLLHFVVELQSRVALNGMEGYTGQPSCKQLTLSPVGC